jgi:hypothetical protein
LDGAHFVKQINTLDIKLAANVIEEKVYSWVVWDEESHWSVVFHNAMKQRSWRLGYNAHLQPKIGEWTKDQLLGRLDGWLHVIRWIIPYFLTTVLYGSVTSSCEVIGSRNPRKVHNNYVFVVNKSWPIENVLLVFLSMATCCLRKSAFQILLRCFRCHYYDA